MLGGRVVPELVRRVFPVILILNAIWLLLLSWFIWEIPANLAAVGYLSIAVISMISFFPPAVLFSMTSPMAISLFSTETPKEKIPRSVGNIYALGTLGSVAGALTAAFILIPYVGLSLSLKIFALIAVVYAMAFLTSRSKIIGAVFLIGCLLFPLPVYRWGEDLGLVLLAQAEGYYQTIRVLTDNSSFIQMNLGPTFHTQMRLSDKEPVFGYAARMVQLAGDVKGKRILIIGGAGHTQARSLEKRGAEVTEVEIDPFVVKLSDRFFGEIAGPVIVTDGRTYLAQSQEKKFDLILVDAFDNLASVPPQLITKEFFEEVKAALTPDGRLIMNFIGVPQGPKANSFRAVSATLHQVFSDTRASNLEGDQLSNVILIASSISMPDIDYPLAPAGGTVLTDDLNPAEIYFEQARADYYFH